MITIPNGECSHRKGILEARKPGTDEWFCAAFEDPDGTKPAIMDCEHEALTVQFSIMGSLFRAAVEGKLDASDAPGLGDFRFTYVDQVPAALDAPVHDTHQASAVLRDILSRI